MEAVEYLNVPHCTRVRRRRGWDGVVRVSFSDTFWGLTGSEIVYCLAVFVLALFHLDNTGAILIFRFLRSLNTKIKTVHRNSPSLTSNLRAIIPSKADHGPPTGNSTADTSPQLHPSVPSHPLRAATSRQEQPTWTPGRPTAA